MHDATAAPIEPTEEPITALERRLAEQRKYARLTAVAALEALNDHDLDEVVATVLASR